MAEDQQRQQQNIQPSVTKNVASNSEAKSAQGYSTDVDHLTRSKRLLAYETSWKNKIKKKQVTDGQLE